MISDVESEKERGNKIWTLPHYHAYHKLPIHR